MRTIQPFIVIALAASLAACGSNSSDTTAQAGKTRPADSSGNGSAAAVAAAARRGVHCPAKVTTPAQATGTPVDDIRDVRPGLTRDEAANLVMCTNALLVVTPAPDRGFRIETFGQKVRQGFTARAAEREKSGQEIMQEMRQQQQARMMNAVQHDLKPGEEKWFVSTMGLPGKERVMGASRESWFPEGKNPTVASVTQALIKKYGTPTQTVDENRSGKLFDRNVRWAYDPRGRLITEASPLYNQCRGISNPNDGFSLSGDCGVVVQAHVVPMRNENADLVRWMAVGVVDQANGYATLTSTEQGLQAMDAARRASEVKKAAANAQAPTL